MASRLLWHHYNLLQPLFSGSSHYFQEVSHYFQKDRHYFQSGARGPPQFLKNATRMHGPMKIFHVGSHQFRKSLRDWALTLQPLLFLERKQGKTGKNKGSSLRGTSKIIGKRGTNARKKQGKSENQKSKDIQKGKDQRATENLSCGFPSIPEIAPGLWFDAIAQVVRRLRTPRKFNLFLELRELLREYPGTLPELR